MGKTEKAWWANIDERWLLCVVRRLLLLATLVGGVAPGTSYAGGGGKLPNVNDPNAFLHQLWGAVSKCSPKMKVLYLAQLGAGRTDKFHLVKNGLRVTQKKGLCSLTGRVTYHYGAPERTQHADFDCHFSRDKRAASGRAARKMNRLKKKGRKEFSDIRRESEHLLHCPTSR